VSVFGVYNIKGGVGKTASTVNLAWLAASEGARTLVWDLDPQGAASFYFRIKPKVKGGARGLIANKDRVRAAIKATDYDNLGLLPANLSYRYLDLELSTAKKPLRAARRVLKPLKQDYDHIFVDCAPNIALSSESLFASVDTLLVPMIPTTLSVRTLHQLTNFLAGIERGELRVIPFFTMVDRR
jgi:cellulose biosynthesis protein BcsQ